MNKKIVMLLVVGLAVFFLLAVVSSAFATGTPPGGTPAPSSGAPGGTPAPSAGTPAPSSSGGSVSGGTTSSGGTTGAKTGADLFLFAGVGTALLGTGYFLIRKVKA